MNCFRRVLIRWEKKLENYMAMVEFAFALIIFKKVRQLSEIDFEQLQKIKEYKEKVKHMIKIPLRR